MFIHSSLVLLMLFQQQIGFSRVLNLSVQKEEEEIIFIILHVHAACTPLSTGYALFVLLPKAPSLCW